MRTRRQLTVHLDESIAAALEMEAAKRGLNYSRALNDILRRVLVDETSEQIADTVKARLDRLDKRDTLRARELAIIKEAILLFVKTWFLHVDPPEDDDPDLEADAEARFERWVELLAWKIDDPG